MKVSVKPHIKICCISSIKEAQLAIDAGANAIGLVGSMPSGPGVIADDLIKIITKSIPTHIATYLLTSETKATEIIAHHKRVITSTIQLVDKLEKNEYALIRESLPTVKLVQVIHVINEDSIEEAKEISKYVDAILLDSGNPNLAVKELGGTGRTHNWNISREIRKSVSVPLFLAGGLNKSNVKKAIETVRPFGVDVCSGVRTDAKLDPIKLDEFFEAIEN